MLATRRSAIVEPLGTEAERTDALGDIMRDDHVRIDAPRLLRNFKSVCITANLQDGSQDGVYRHCFESVDAYIAAGGLDGEDAAPLRDPPVWDAEFTANESREYDHLKGHYVDEQATLLSLKLALISRMNPAFRTRHEHSTPLLRQRPLWWLYGKLTSIATLSTAERDAVMNELESLKMKESDTFITIEAKFVSRFQELAQGGKPIAEHDQMRMLRKALADLPFFEREFRAYEAIHRPANTEAFETLSAFLDEADSRRHRAPTPSELGFQQAPALHLNQATAPQVVADQVDYKTLYLAAIQQQTGAGAGPNATLQQQYPHCPHYCWTHGPNKSHGSAACERKKEGHKPAATYANTMGGRRNQPWDRNKKRP